MHRSSGGASPSLRTLHQWQPNHHHTFALTQYVKALRRLRDKLDRLNSEHDKALSNVALVACLLFMCLEMLQGNHGASLQHLRTGLRILAESHKIVPSALCGEEEKRYYINSQVGKGSPTIDQSLISVFARLDYEATMFDKRAPLLVLQSPYQGGDEIPGVFESIEQARSQLNKLSSEVFHFRADLLRQIQPVLKEGKERDWVKEFVTQHITSRRLVHSGGEPILDKLHRLQDNLTRWLSAFRSFLVAPQWPTSETTTTLALNLLEIQHFYMFFTAQTYFDTTESECDRFTPMFKHVIEMAESVLQMDRNNGEQDKVTFTLEPGILPSLFLITLKCRDSGLRRRALGLLDESYCQEGMWEGALLAKFMKQVIDMEEHLSAPTDMGKLQAEDVPEEARFSDVALVGIDTMPGWGRLVGGRSIHGTGEIVLRERIFVIH
ncbi:hypothetical protein PISL3812_02136 [Talaromyces islandicus]|uniref:C6 zinc finger domain protein n=1 Tax=Talaromyces islandicus TaxID=28573 RepID=A0A0U1LP19_TALIS|nr:hypothetical protein PISL3812_02136 [Talaromyces islandicus]